MAQSYDEKLLAATSHVTRADLQDGYDPDLLSDESNLRSRQPTLRYTDLSPLRSDTHASSTLDGKERDLESAIPLQADIDHVQSPNRLETAHGHGTRPMPLTINTTTSTTANPTTKKAVPFWRTRKGIAILVVIAVVVIALAAGLGGGLGSRKSNSTSNSAANGVQDAGQAASQGGGTSAASATTPESTASPGIDQTTHSGANSEHQGPDDAPETAEGSQGAGVASQGGQQAGG